MVSAIRFSLIVTLLFFTASFFARADTPGLIVYRLDKVPDVSAIVQTEKGAGGMFIAFSGATASGATDTFNKLLEFDFTGKPRCTEIHFVDLGMGWTAKPCVTIKHIDDGHGTFAINVVIKFRYPPEVDNAFLKENDFVKERRFTMHFLPDPAGCRVAITERTFIPVDGKKSVASRIGPGGCQMKYNFD